MKKLFTILTISVLANTSHVQAKFNIENVLQEKIPGRAYAKIAKRFTVLSLKKNLEDANTANGSSNRNLIENEKRTLEALLNLKLVNSSKSNMRKAKANYIAAETNRKAAIGKFNDKKATKEEYIQRWQYLIEKDIIEGTSSFLDRMHLVGWGTFKKNEIQPDLNTLRKVYLIAKINEKDEKPVKTINAKTIAEVRNILNVQIPIMLSKVPAVKPEPDVAKKVVIVKDAPVTPLAKKMDRKVRTSEIKKTQTGKDISAKKTPTVNIAPKKNVSEAKSVNKNKGKKQK